jgi:hypothetical protein
MAPQSGDSMVDADLSEALLNEELREVVLSVLDAGTGKKVLAVMQVVTLQTYFHF